MTLGLAAQPVRWADWFQGLWASMWQQSPLMTRLSLREQFLVRLAKIVATLAYEYGRRTSTSFPTTNGLPEVGHRVRACSSTAEEHKENSTVSVAVIIPVLATTSSQLEQLRKAVCSIGKQTWLPARTFIIDDGSEPPIKENFFRAREDGSELCQGLSIYRLTTNRGPATARNAGLELAREAGMKVVCFTDSDCRPDKGWVQAFMSHFQQDTSAAVLGGCTRSLGKRGVDKMHDIFGTLNPRMLPDMTLLYVPTCNMALQLDAIPPFLEFPTTFHEAAFEDVAFCIRARWHGAILHYVDDAVVLHDYDNDLTGLWRQFSRYGRSSSRMQQEHPEYNLEFKRSVEITAFNVPEDD